MTHRLLRGQRKINKYKQNDFHKMARHASTYVYVTRLRRRKPYTHNSIQLYTLWCVQFKYFAHPTPRPHGHKQKNGHIVCCPRLSLSLCCLDRRGAREPVFTSPCLAVSVGSSTASGLTSWFQVFHCPPTYQSFILNNVKSSAMY